MCYYLLLLIFIISYYYTIIINNYNRIIAKQAICFSDFINKCIDLKQFHSKVPNINKFISYHQKLVCNLVIPCQLQLFQLDTFTHTHKITLLLVKNLHFTGNNVYFPKVKQLPDRHECLPSVVSVSDE